MAFVCKQTIVLVVRINNIEQQQWCFNRLIAIFLTLYFTTYLSWPDWLYFYCFFSFEYFDSFDHYAACWFPLSLSNQAVFASFPLKVAWSGISLSRWPTPRPLTWVWVCWFYYPPEVRRGEYCRLGVFMGQYSLFVYSFTTGHFKCINSEHSLLCFLYYYYPPEVRGVLGVGSIPVAILPSGHP